MSKEREKFIEIVKNLDANERKKAKSYKSAIADVFVAKVVNPKSGKIQYRIELKMIGEFKPTAIIKSSMHMEELKKFIKWLEDRRGYLEALDELNGNEYVSSDEVAEF